MSDDQLSTTIRTYAASGNIDAIITLVGAMRDQRDRAELTAAAHLHQVKLLAQRFAAITEPATGKLVTAKAEAKAGAGAGAPPRPPKAPTFEAEVQASISLDDL